MPGAQSGELNPPNGGNTENTEDPPKFMTEDDVAKMVTGAVQGTKKTLQKELAATIAQALDAALLPIKEQLAKPPAPPEPAPNDKQRPEENPAVVLLKKQLDDMSVVMKAAQDEAASEKRKSEVQSQRASLRSGLTGKVKPELIEDLVDLLHFRGHVGKDDTGQTTFKWRSSLSKGMPEEEHQFPFEDGLREFLKSKQAESYLPPPNSKEGFIKPGQKLANGTIATTPHYTKAAASEDEKLRRSVEITNALTARGIGGESAG